MWLSAISKKVLFYNICCNWSLILTSLIFSLLGIILIIVGAWAQSNPILQLAGQSGTIGFLVLGIVVLFTALLGIYGSRISGEDLRYLKIYCVFMFVLVISQITLGSVLISQGTDVTTNSLLEKGWENSDNDFRLSWEERLNCCGFSVFNVTAGLPCPDTATEPCLTSLVDNYKYILTIVSGISITFGILELLGICTAIGVIKSSKIDGNRPLFDGVNMDDDED